MIESLFEIIYLLESKLKPNRALKAAKSDELQQIAFYIGSTVNQGSADSALVCSISLFQVGFRAHWVKFFNFNL